MTERRAWFWGVPVDPLTLEALHDCIAQAVRLGRRDTILHVNAHALNLAWDRADLRSCFQAAQKVVCDGKGVQYAARLLGSPLPARVTYADWMWELAALAADQSFSLYLLGGRRGVAEQAAAALRRRLPNLRITGCHHGYFDKSSSSQENAAVLAGVNEADPDILIAAFGMPLQELWVHENRNRLQARVALCGGAAFDYISGNLPRGPAWMTQHGWEWLARLAIEPRRLWRRYLIGNPQFVCRVLRQRLRLVSPR